VRPRLVIVDDSELFRTAAAELLSAGGFDVVATAVDGADGLAVAARWAPDVVVVDVALPDGSGFDVARHLTARVDAPQVVLVSSRDWAGLDELLSDSGAVAFIAKPELDGSALRAALAGGRT
jgi:DNA-binding NarL/FixJ family response regulator